MKLFTIQTIDHNEDGSMYILPECFAGIKQKRLKKMKKKTPKEIKTLTNQRK